MRGLTDLHAILCNNRQALKIGLKDFDVWQESGRMLPGGMRETANGYEYAKLEYRAVVYVERLPADRGALCLALMRQYADQREAADNKNIDIEFDQTNLTGKQINLEITLQLTDALYMTEVDASPIDYAGKKLAPVTPERPHPLHTAETGTVTGGVK